MSNSNFIPLMVPDIRQEDIDAVAEVLRSGILVQGEKVKALEKSIAEYLGIKHAVAVSSGTATLHIALVTFGIGPDDEVIVPAFSYIATANVVELVGARLVLADVCPHTYNITPETLKRAIAQWDGPEKIKAVIPVHEFGCPVDMTAIVKMAKEHRLIVIEDAACALGATHAGKMVGTFGDLGCFSFHPRKAMTTGEGGAVVVHDRLVSQKLRQLRNHGMQLTDHEIKFVVAGFNYRLTNFQAALGRVQLKRFPGWLLARYSLQKIYRKELAPLAGIVLPAGVNGHAWQTFMVMLPESIDRGRVIARLRESGVESNLGAYAVHAQPYYENKYPGMAQEMSKGVSRRLYNHGLALPFYAALNKTEVELVAEALSTAIT